MRRYLEKFTFTVFSDLHYKEGMYLSSVGDLKAILDRAVASGSEFVLSGGDLCNDFLGSPELSKEFLHHARPDGSIVPVYNVYGNHELESYGNSMEVVTPLLTNDKKIFRGGKKPTVGYYYFDFYGYRIIALDTNYSYNRAEKIWEHNHTASYGPPSENIKGNSLGPVQRKWLKKVLMESALTGTPCIILSHDGFSGMFATGVSDAHLVREIFAEANKAREGTVFLCINGHSHTNHHGYRDGIFYLDIPAVRNGRWINRAPAHYPPDMTFDAECYDEQGNLKEIVKKPICSLTQASNTWFWNKPLSSVLTIEEDGMLTIEGSSADWVYGVTPEQGWYEGDCRSVSGSFPLSL